MDEVRRSLTAWCYAYYDAGDVVGTSDARGCGSNYHYDAGGRLVAEDYSPCRDSHAPYTAPNLATGDGTEVFNWYDVPDRETAPGIAWDAVQLTQVKGRLVSVSDRASKTLTQADYRGRVTAIARKVAKPGEASETLADGYAPRWYVQEASFDGADRVTRASTGATAAGLLGADGKSELTTS